MPSFIISFMLLQHAFSKSDGLKAISWIRSWRYDRIFFDFFGFLLH